MAFMLTLAMGLEVFSLNKRIVSKSSAIWNLLRICEESVKLQRKMLVTEYIFSSYRKVQVLYYIFNKKNRLYCFLYEFPKLNVNVKYSNIFAFTSFHNREKYIHAVKLFRKENQINILSL